MEDSYHESPCSSDCRKALPHRSLKNYGMPPEPKSSGIGIARIPVGVGDHDLFEAGHGTRRDLLGGIAGDGDRIGEALDAVRDRFGDHAVVRGRAFRSGPVRQGRWKVE